MICVDHKWRDLPGHVYAKVLLQKLGYRVILIRNNFEEYYADIYDPCAVVMIHAYDRQKSVLIKKLKQRGILVFLMPTEGIPTIASVRRLAAGHFSDLSDVDVQFLWNRRMLELMEEGNVLSSERLCVVGVPRFDFYCEPLKGLLPRREHFCGKYDLDPCNPIITWATNFTNAGFCKKNADFLRSDWKKLQVDKVLDPDDVARCDYESREMHFESVVRLLREIDDASLLLKLHPSEEHGYYYEKLKALDQSVRSRIRIIYQRYIWDVLNVTDVLLDRSCTTGIEAWLMGRPTIEMRLNPDEWYYSQEHASGSDEVSNYDELKRCVSYYLDGKPIPESLLENRKKFIAQWCHEVDGQSTMRFVTKIDKVIRSQQGSSNGLVKTRLAGYLKSLFITSLMEMTNFRIHNFKVYGLGRSKDKLGRFDKYFDRRDEKYWLTKISSVVGRETSQ